MMAEMFAPPTVALVLQVGLHLTLGGLTGLVYFWVVRLSADLFAHRRRMALAVALALGRLLLIGGLLILVAREGTLPLLAFALGFLFARALAIHHARVNI